MTENAKRTRRLALIILSALYVYIYLLFHIPNYVFDPDDLVGTSRDVYLVIRQASEKIVNYLAPALVAALVFVTESRVKWAAVAATVYSLPVLLYSIPFVYLYGISEGYDTPESVGISLGISALGLLIQILRALALYLIARLIAAKKMLPAARVELFGAKTPSAAEKGCSAWKRADSMARADICLDKPLSLESSGGVGIFAICFVEFAVRIVMELISTVLFFANTEGNVSLAELITVILTYVFLLFELLLVFAVCGAVRNRAIREAEEYEAERRLGTAEQNSVEDEN